MLAVALVLAMSPWFVTAAVAGQLAERWQISETGLAWLVIAVQLGFVVGASVFTVAGVADRLGPRRMILLGATTAAAANALLLVVPNHGLAIAVRALTGCALAAVYPPALKAMSGWFRPGAGQGRGRALGIMVAGLTVGSALPHLINGLGGLEWQTTVVTASVLTFIGGLLADRVCLDGPFTSAPVSVDLGQVGSIVRNRQFVLASGGYFGHMWELYAMWAWIAAFYRDALDSEQAASLGAFAAISAGAAGAVYVGGLSDKGSRARSAALAMKWSGLLAATFGFLAGAPAFVVLIAGLVWGFWVVADSAQFSTIVSEVVDPAVVGTALTIQLASGFVLTVFTIFFVPVLRDWAGWGPAFLLLAPGPLLGAWAMHRLELEP